MVRWYCAQTLPFGELTAETNLKAQGFQPFNPRCEVGIESLRAYRRKYDEKKKILSDAPQHDWASHGSDAFRGLAVRHQVPEEAKKRMLIEQPREFAWS